MAYSKQVVDRFESVLNNPDKHAVGRFDPNDPNVATGLTGAPACGDVMKLQLKLADDIIEDVKFKTYGCGSAIASSTMFADMLKGKTITEAIINMVAKKKKKSTVNKAGNYTKPTMRKNLFNRIKAGSKGGKPGQWSARKAQMLAKQYKAKGGGYK